MIDQLVAAAGSIDANRNEATSATTRREFIRYNELALRSAKESAVWLRGCEKGCWGDEQSRRRLLDEARQIARILGAIVNNSKKRGDGSKPLT